jgi:fatty acid desaturase
MAKPTPESIRELRRLKFSARLQIIATIFFIGAGIISGLTFGWGFTPFLLIVLGLANIGLFIVTKQAIDSRTESK